MNKAFEKILERLDAKKQYFQKFYEADGKTEEDEYINKATQLAFDDAKQIVQEVAEEFATDTNVGSNGWIPCSEQLPEEYGEYLVWWTDITRGQYYEIVEYEPDNGWIGEIPQAFEGKYSVIAWQPLPEPFKERD